MKVKQNRTNKGVLAKEKICECCNTPFIANRSTARYCNDTCKDRMYRKRKNDDLKREIKKRYNL